ncbi:MAG: NAD-dependent epimerase/dehydratase family protein [Coprococcus sp.]|nr:NAD-dependent epimerase/dehydratase family protein [Coprococcus sp.]
MDRKILMRDAEAIAGSPIDWTRLEGKVLWISGANGYVPQYIVHGLLKRNDLYHSGIKIIAMCRNKERAEQRFSAYRNREDFELFLQDVRIPIQYEGHVDYIIHAASPAGTVDRYEDPVATFDANVIGCKNMLEFARKKCADFLLISSIDIYGSIPGCDRFVEDRVGELNPLNLRNVYACAKRAAETLCACYSYKNVGCKIVRPSQILAGGIALDDGRLHIDFISQMLNGNMIVLKGDGTPRRTFLYITDAVTGMLTVLLEGQSGEAYNLCAEECEASVLELAQIMVSHVKDREVKISYDMETRKKDPAVTQVVSVVCGCADKISSLGWKPEVSLNEACKRMMAYYRVT